MRQFFLKISGRPEGPYPEEQIAQMFENSRVDRNTPCRSVTDQVWKTIDDHLPTLKYGVQLPSPPATPSAVHNQLKPTPAGQQVAIVDINLPFSSIFLLMLKCMAASIILALILAIIIGLVWLVVAILFAGVLTALVGHR